MNNFWRSLIAVVALSCGFIGCDDQSDETSKADNGYSNYVPGIDDPKDDPRPDVPNVDNQTVEADSVVAKALNDAELCNYYDAFNGLDSVYNNYAGNAQFALDHAILGLISTLNQKAFADLPQRLGFENAIDWTKFWNDPNGVFVAMTDNDSVFWEAASDIAETQLKHKFYSKDVDYDSVQQQCLALKAAFDPTLTGNDIAQSLNSLVAHLIKIANALAYAANLMDTTHMAVRAGCGLDQITFTQTDIQLLASAASLAVAAIDWINAYDHPVKVAELLESNCLFQNELSDWIILETPDQMNAQTAIGINYLTQLNTKLFAPKSGASATLGQPQLIKAAKLLKLALSTPKNDFFALSKLPSGAKTDLLNVLEAIITSQDGKVSLDSIITPNLVVDLKKVFDTPAPLAATSQIACDAETWEDEDWDTGEKILFGSIMCNGDVIDNERYYNWINAILSDNIFTVQSECSEDPEWEECKYYSVVESSEKYSVSASDAWSDIRVEDILDPNYYFISKYDR